MSLEEPLVVSPRQLKFQLPFPQAQYRQLCLMNLCDKNVVYRIDFEDADLFQAQPPIGTICGYETLELTLTMQPCEESKQDYILMVKYKLKEPDEDVSDLQLEGDWTGSVTTEVRILLEDSAGPGLNLRKMFGMDANTNDVAQLVGQKYEPPSLGCNRNQQAKTDKLNMVRWKLWPLLFLLLSIITYLVWEWNGIRKLRQLSLSSSYAN